MGCYFKMNEEKKSVPEDQNIEETSQSRDPGRDRGPTKPTPEPLENPGKVDRGETSDENIQPDSPGKGDRGQS